ncbi:hypothetical protein DINM_002970 [Dirofilaria immitis]|nr:hypothetical protein [Dirofilaria immitis]
MRDSDDDAEVEFASIQYFSRKAHIPIVSGTSNFYRKTSRKYVSKTEHSTATTFSYLSLKIPEDWSYDHMKEMQVTLFEMKKDEHTRSQTMDIQMIETIAVMIEDPFFISYLYALWRLLLRLI